MKKIIRTATVPSSLNILLKGQLNFLNNSYEVLAVSSPGEDLEEVAQREKVKTVSVRMERKISIFKDLLSLIKLYLLFKKEKPVLVHSITPKAGLLSMIAAKLAGVPIRVHTFTGLIFPTAYGFKKKLLITMDKILCKCATNIFPEGNGVKQDLKTYNITTKELKILGNGNVNGIDLKFFSPHTIDSNQTDELRNELDIQSNQFVFVYVGRIVRDKGIHELVSSFKKVNQLLPNTKLILVGKKETDLSDPVKQEIMVEIETNPNIIQVGFQRDIRNFLAISHALVFPSYREGFPNVVLQAGAMGIPSIVTDINGSNEIIIEGVNGTIIPVKDESKLFDRMYLFAQDIQYVSKLKENSREMIKWRFEQNALWGKIQNEYELLIKNVK